MPLFNASKTVIYWSLLETYFEKVPERPISNFSENLSIPFINFVTWDFENVEVFTQDKAVQNRSIRLSCSGAKFINNDAHTWMLHSGKIWKTKCKQTTGEPST